MKNVKELKRSVDLQMRKCWGESCAMFTISAGGLAAALFAWYLTADFLFAMEMIDSFINKYMAAVTLVIVLLLWTIAVPYKYGSRWYRLQQVRGHSVHAKSIFSCYFSAKKLFSVYKLSALVILGKSLFFIPLVLLLGAAAYLITRADAAVNEALYSAIVVILLMLSAAAYIIYLMAGMKYSAVCYIFALGHDRPAKDIIEESKRFMKGKSKYMAELMRSLAVLLLPCILVFPMFFIVPRVKMIYTAAINEIIESGFAEDIATVTERREKSAAG